MQLATIVHLDPLALCSTVLAPWVQVIQLNKVAFGFEVAIHWTVVGSACAQPEEDADEYESMKALTAFMAATGAKPQRGRPREGAARPAGVGALVCRLILIQLRTGPTSRATQEKGC